MSWRDYLAKTILERMVTKPTPTKPGLPGGYPWTLSPIGTPIRPKPVENPVPGYGPKYRPQLQAAEHMMAADFDQAAALRSIANQQKRLEPFLNNPNLAEPPRGWGSTPFQPRTMRRLEEEKNLIESGAIAPRNMDEYSAIRDQNWPAVKYGLGVAVPTIGLGGMGALMEPRLPEEVR
jgi:hypothetical protein